MTTSLRVAAIVNTSSRFRIALLRAAKEVSAGTPLSDAFPADGFRIKPELVHVMDVGERRGCIQQELSSYAIRTDAQTTSLLHVIIGRSREAKLLASALARLLGQHTLSPELIHDAASLVASANSRFGRVMRQVAEEVEGGGPFGEAMARHPRYFDALFCECVGASDSRERLQFVLHLLAK